MPQLCMSPCLLYKGCSLYTNRFIPLTHLENLLLVRDELSLDYST